MLQKKINDCRQEMSKIYINESKIIENSSVVKANNTFFDSLDKLEWYIKFYLLASNKFEIVFSENVINQIKGCIEQCEYNFENYTVKNAASFKGKTNVVCTAIQNEWEKYATNKDDELIEQMTILKTVSKKQKQIQEIITALNNIKTGILSDEKYQNYCFKKQEAEKLLKDVHFDSEIEQFLKKISKKEATLLDLNETILKWIKEENLQKSIALSIKIS